MQQSCSRARIRVTCARASVRPAPARVPARRSAKRAGRAGGWDPIQRARRFMTRAILPVGIPLIPLNPAESRIPFKFCPSWKAEPDRDTVEKCGLVSCSRSFYPCARRPRHVMAGHARTRSGYPAIHVLSSVRRAWWLEMPGPSPRAILPVGIPLIPLNPAESRIRFKFCPSWRAEPDRDTAEKCGLVSCSRSFYPCALRPRHVMAGLARTCSGYPAIHVLSSVRRAGLLELPGTSPGMTACGSGRSERPRTGPTTCKRNSETRPYGCGPKGASFNSTTSWVSTDGRTLPAKPMNASLAKSLAQ